MSKRITFLRLSEEDERLLEGLAKYYGIAKADVIRIALKEYAKNHNVEVASS
jgi:predicted DNA-binding protein